MFFYISECETNLYHVDDVELIVVIQLEFAFHIEQSKHSL